MVPYEQAHGLNDQQSRKYDKNFRKVQRNWSHEEEELECAFLQRNIEEMKQTMKDSQNIDPAGGQEARQGLGPLQAYGDVCCSPETPHWALQKTLQKSRVHPADP